MLDGAAVAGRNEQDAVDLDGLADLPAERDEGVLLVASSGSKNPAAAVGLLWLRLCRALLEPDRGRQWQSPLGRRDTGWRPDRVMRDGRPDDDSGPSTEHVRVEVTVKLLARLLADDEEEPEAVLASRAHPDG